MLFAMPNRTHEPPEKRARSRPTWSEPLLLLSCVLGFVALLRPFIASCDPASPAHASEATPTPILASESASVLGDLYAWENDAGRLVLVLTYAQGIEPGGDPVYDPDLLYMIWLHHGPDWEFPDRVIGIRFGQNERTSQWGVQIRHVPGAGEDMVGPVEETIEAGTARAWVGLRDDPFFFDAEGLQDVLDAVENQQTLAALPFDADRDGFAGTNAMAIVIELDMPAQDVGFYATVGRAP
jgi:hypothetical protein